MPGSFTEQKAASGVGTPAWEGQKAGCGGLKVELKSGFGGPRPSCPKDHGVRTRAHCGPGTAWRRLGVATKHPAVSGGLRHCCLCQPLSLCVCCSGSHCLSEVSRSCTLWPSPSLRSMAPSLPLSQSLSCLWVSLCTSLCLSPHLLHLALSPYSGGLSGGDEPDPSPRVRDPGPGQCC